FRIKNQTYPTLKFIEDLRCELRNYSEELAMIFPKRITKYSNRDLSRLWNGYDYYIKNLKRRKETYRIENEKLDLLKTRIFNFYGSKSIKCFDIIQRYEKYKIDRNLLFFMLRAELGRISGLIEVTNEEMGIILQGTPYYIHDKIFFIRSQNPNFKFSIERLDYMEQNIKIIFVFKAKGILKFIQKYKRINPDLKLYSKQQYVIKKPYFFKKIDTFEKAYWFGFLQADGWLDLKECRLGLELSIKDKDQVIAWAKLMGLESNRVKERIRILKYKGKIKSFKMVNLKFVCKPMAIDLFNHGFIKLKKGTLDIPKFVTKSIRKKNKIIAYAWLLGLFDGDGTLNEDKKLVRLYSNNKMLLIKIKYYFNICYGVLKNHEGQLCEFISKNSNSEYIKSKPQYSLQIDWDIFKNNLNIRNYGLQRKRV
ncbi:MAG: LAGLIDADG family homing endonuclease, partial [Promethearchaeota archaeon]